MGDAAITHFECAHHPDFQPFSAKVEAVGALGQHRYAIGGNGMHYPFGSVIGHLCQKGARGVAAVNCGHGHIVIDNVFGQQPKGAFGFHGIDARDEGFHGLLRGH